MTSRLSGVTRQPFGVVSPDSADNSYTVTFQGALSNNTTATIEVGSHEIPRVDGLDSAGNLEYWQVLGEYDQSPPPGRPKSDVLILQPGQSISFTASAFEHQLAFAGIRYWYTDTALGRPLNLVFHDAQFVFRCPVGREAPAGGSNIANTFR